MKIYRARLVCRRYARLHSYASFSSSIVFVASLFRWKLSFVFATLLGFLSFHHLGLLLCTLNQLLHALCQYPISLSLSSCLFITPGNLTYSSCVEAQCLAQFQKSVTQIIYLRPLPNGGSKFQVLLHDFPSLRQQSQETCAFYCALQKQKASPESRATPGTKYAPETASFCRSILMATCSLLQCFREDFLIRQLV